MLRALLQNNILVGALCQKAKCAQMTITMACCSMALLLSPDPISLG